MFSKQLGENNPRSMGIEYNQRAVHITALSRQKSTRTPVLSNRTGRSGQRNSGHATQRSSGRNLQFLGKGRFLFQHVPGPQKRWPAETGIQSKKAKYFCTHRTLQNGRKFLRFQNQGKAHQFKCLQFGLSSTPWVFTKTLHPVVTLLRELGLRMVVYIDNILVMAESESQLKDHV